MTSVDPVKDISGNVTGYTISFTKGEPVTITNGATGPQGPTGPQRPNGPQGPGGTGSSNNSNDSCHDDSSHNHNSSMLFTGGEVTIIIFALITWFLIVIAIVSYNRAGFYRPWWML